MKSQVVPRIVLTLATASNLLLAGILLPLGAMGEIPAHVPSVPNMVRVHTRVMSGGTPDEAAIQRLSQLGVRTIISVDGARPNIELANRYGMTYFHVPVGYDGVPAESLAKLVRIVKQAKGTVYVHCHHGKHRAPACAAAACVAAEMIDRPRGLQLMKQAGTNPRYQGLFRSVREAKTLSRAKWQAAEIRPNQVATAAPVTQVMVQLDQLVAQADRVKAPSSKAQSSEPVSSAAGQRSEVAVLIAEQFTELLRRREVQRQPEDFRKWLEASREQATKMTSIRDSSQYATQLKQLKANCTACHKKYRN